MDKISKQFGIEGMTCTGCQKRIETALQTMDGVLQARVAYATGEAYVVYDAKQISFGEIVKIVENLDYSVIPFEHTTSVDVVRVICTVIILLSLYVILEHTNLLTMLVPDRLADSGMGYGMLFVIGLITSVHCIAMCGGINLSQSLPGRGNAAQNPKRAFLPTFFYNLGRVISYTGIGFLLGFVGMLFGSGQSPGVSSLLQGILKMAAGIFMVLMGIYMLRLFPGLDKLHFALPGLDKLRFKTAHSLGSRGPFWVGMLNSLMPCGPLQSMQIVALASGNPVAGAFSMFCFSLGTVPLMLGPGSMISLPGKRFAKTVTTAGAVLVVVLGLSMFTQGGNLSGFFLTGDFVSAENTASTDSVRIEDGIQYVNSMLKPGEYPDITVQSGMPVRWTIYAPEGSINGCNYKMIFQNYGLEYALDEGENLIEFTPTESGSFSYTCRMGMIRGTVRVTGTDDVTGYG